MVGLLLQSRRWLGRKVPRLSLIVITKNEEAAIARCLRSADFADEIIVIDHGSSDRTVEIARALGARAEVTGDWPGFGPQKNRALAMATGDWVLSLDADEWIEPPLALEVSETIARADAADGYEIPRRSRFCGKVVRHGDWRGDRVLRLFRKGRARFSDDKVHERVIVDGRIGRLSSPLEHDSITDPADAQAKIERYASAAADKLAAEGKRSSAAKAAIRGWAAFLRGYVLRFGFLDGRTGIGVAEYNRRYTYEKWARLAKRPPRS
jgi:glycosyltransferase involved in cell wall biosynthesis